MSSAGTTCDPTFPVAPVTNTFVITHHSFPPGQVPRLAGFETRSYRLTPAFIAEQPG